MDSLLRSDSSRSSLPTQTLSSTRRKNFDDRAQTAVSLQLMAHKAMVPGTDGIDRIRQLLHASENTQDIINWSETRHICKALNSPKFLARFGAPSAIELSPTHILVGTSLGRVAVFNYFQNLEFLLELAFTEAKEPLNPLLAALAVTCVAVSASGMHVSAGHADGKIIVWEIPSKPTKKLAPDVILPFETVRSVSLRERAASSDVLGHLHYVPISTVSFVGDLYQNIVSSDVSGLVLFHHGFQRLFRKNFALQRLWGHHVATLEDILDRFCVHDCQVLPIGTAPQLTDHIGLLAVITSNALVVLSICSLNNESAPYPKTHFKAIRPENVRVDSENSSLGCLAWYPSIKIQREAKNPVVKNAKLAYSWNNVLTIVEVDNSRIPTNAMAIIADFKDKDRAIPKLELVKTARWVSPDPTTKILALQWLNSEILTALVQDTASEQTTLFFLYYNTHPSNYALQIVATDRVDALQVSWMEFSSGNPPLKLRLYNLSLRIFKHRLVVLVGACSACLKLLLTGVASKWADRLMGLITRKDFAQALWCAYDFYCSDNVGQLLLSGLPHTTRERHDVVEPFLLDIMRESVDTIFRNEHNEHNELVPMKLEDRLWFYFYLTGIISSDHGGITGDDVLEVLENIHEIVGDRNLYFDVLEPFVLSGKIRTLSPTVFKSLVETYVDAGKGERLTEIICILDTATLNIDLTLRLCAAHNLRECLIYIWTAVLKDYMRPLFMLMAAADSGLHTITEEQKNQRNLVFTYISYTLSGRTFPADDYMSTDDETMARTAICNVLFAFQARDDTNAREFQVNIDHNTVFPYLHKLLQFNTFEALATLNEFFENPCLNSETKGELNRQYVIEALIDTFRENKDAFLAQDRVHLAIFLARNYPKYFQFIRISDSVLEETVEMLCNSPKDCHDDAELALESLLPVYNVKNEEFFVERIKAARFFKVAFEMSRAKQKFSSALEIWMEQQKDEHAVDMHRNFGAFSDIVSHTFGNRNVSQTEQGRLFRIIGENFEQLIAQNVREMVTLANAYNVSMHQLVLKCENKTLAYEYLKILFENGESFGGGGTRIGILCRFVELSCVFARDIVASLADRYSLELLKPPHELLSLRETLKQHKCFDALAVLSRNNGDSKQSIEELQQGFNVAAENGEWPKMDTLVSIGISVCEKDQRCWQHLVQALVSLPIPAAPANKAIAELVDQGIYKCFRRIIDRSEKERNPHFFTDILQGVMDEATLSHVRAVLQETLTSFYFDSEIHNITLLKLNGRICKYMEHIRLDCLRGWILKDRQCASCGKPMWGDEVYKRHLAAWESREKAQVFSQKFDKEEFKDCEITLFKCLHGYHSQCLERLGSAGRCVICTP